MRRAKHRLTLLLIACSLAALIHVGCGPGQAGTGDVTISLAANQAVQQGFPHVEDGIELAFIDGWSLRITHYVIGIGSFTLTQPAEGGRGEVVAQWSGPALVDVASENTGVVTLGTIQDVPAQRLDVGFDMVRATSDAARIGVPDAIALQMIQNNWSTYVEAIATPTAQNTQFTQPVTLKLGFTIAAEYYDCNNGIDLTKGMIVEANKNVDVYIFPHIVHLFWDRLAGGNEQLLLNPMAAVAQDGIITTADLERVDLTTLFDDNTGVPYYDDGGLLDAYTLAAYADRAMLESMHFNGVGFCKKRLN